MDVKYYTQPSDNNGNSFYLGVRLNEVLKSQKPFFNRIWMIASFAKLSGISKLKAGLKKSVKNNAVINFVLGTGKNLTTVEALNELAQIGCNVKIYRNVGGSSFGAKIFCFEAEGEQAEVFICSGNITEGGLYKNHELITNITYNLENGDKNAYEQFKDSLSKYFNPSGISACDLTQESIDILVDAGEISFESEEKLKTKTTTKRTKSKKEEKIKDDEPELLSIILPTGDSIEISLDDDDADIESKFEPVVKNEKNQSKNGSAKKKKVDMENEQLQQDDIEIVIEESERVEESEFYKNSEEINEEFSEEAYSLKSQESGKSKNQEADIHIIDFSAIDIEQMLYHQQHEDENSEDTEHKRQSGISSDSIEFIKSKETKKSPKKTKEKLTEKEPEPVKEIVRKKFIISSIANKNGTGIINSFFMQINKLKGRGMSSEVRMPIASRDFSPEFWGWPNSYSISHGEGKNQKKCKKWQVKCRVLDVENPANVMVDSAELYQEEGKSNFIFLSKMLVTLEPEENDIIRIIRCMENDECSFQCELIRAGSKEYEIWEQFCAHTIKGTGRRYGFA